MCELALGEEVNLNLVDDDARVVDRGGELEAPELFAILVGDGDGFAFSGDEVMCGAGSFDKDMAKPSVGFCSAEFMSDGWR